MKLSFWINSILNNRRLMTFTGLMLILLSAVAAYVVIPCGIDFVDEPYQVMLAISPDKSPSAPLSAWLFHWFIKLFDPGANVLPMRWVCWAISQSVLVVPCLYFRRRTGNTSITWVIFGTLSLLVTLMPKQTWMYSWDVVAVWFLTLWLTALLYYAEKPTLPRVITLAILCALTTLSRVPSGMLLPLGIVCICFINRRKAPGWLKPAAAYCAVFGVAVYGFIAAIYGPDPRTYMKALTDNTVSAHGGVLSPRYTFAMAGYLMKWVALMGASLLLWLKLFTTRYRSAQWYWLAAGFAFVTVYSSMPFYKEVPWPHHKPIFTLSAMLALWAMVFFKKEFTMRQKGLALALLLGCWTAWIGSNVPMVKMLVPGSIPLLLSLSGALRTRRVGLWLSLYMLVSMGLYAGTMARGLHFHTGVTSCTATVHNGSFEGLRTTPELASRIEHYVELTDSIKGTGQEVMVISNDITRFGWELLAGRPNETLRHNWNFPKDTHLSPPVREMALALTRDSAANRAIVAPAAFEDFERATGMAPPNAALDSIFGEQGFRILRDSRSGSTVFVR